MAADWLEWACTALGQDEAIVVPVKKLWNAWLADHAGPGLETFTAGLLADERVELMGQVDHAEGLEGLSAAELAGHVAEMEALGYFSGPRVKLRARDLSLEHIVGMITRHNDRVESALRQARAALPDDVDEATEGLLIDIQAKAAEFRQRLRQAGLEGPDAASPSA